MPGGDLGEAGVLTVSGDGAMECQMRVNDVFCAVSFSGTMRSAVSVLLEKKRQRKPLACGSKLNLWSSWRLLANASSQRTTISETLEINAIRRNCLQSATWKLSRGLTPTTGTKTQTSKQRNVTDKLSQNTRNCDGNA